MEWGNGVQEATSQQTYCFNKERWIHYMIICEYKNIHFDYIYVIKIVLLSYKKYIQRQLDTADNQQRCQRRIWSLRRKEQVCLLLSMWTQKLSKRNDLILHFGSQKIKIFSTNTQEITVVLSEILDLYITDST